MHLPNPLSSWVSVSLYLILIFVIAYGIYQWTMIRKQKVDQVRSLVPIGGIAIALGFIGYFVQMNEAFDAIEMAGDISPALVAGAISKGPDYIILGLVILIVSLAFRFTNQKRSI